MPGVYSDSGYDLAGFAVGAVERPALLPRTDLMSAGDVLLGLPAAGLHSNGFSLVRRVVETAGLDYLKDKAPFQSAAESLGKKATNFASYLEQWCIWHAFSYK